MTTIAYCAGTMSADTQVTSCNRKFRTHKVHRLPCGGLIGCTGSLVDAMKVVRWAEAGFSGAAPDLGDEADVECLVVRGDGSAFLIDESLEPMPVMGDFIAIGSGGPYAMAAMACGRSPADAIRVAAMFDAGTSEPVESWALEPVSPAKGKKKRKP